MGVDSCTTMWLSRETEEPKHGSGQNSVAGIVLLSKPRNLRSHPHTPVPGTPDVSPTVYVSEFFLFGGFGEVWGIFPGALWGKMIEESNRIRPRTLDAEIVRKAKAGKFSSARPLIHQGCSTTVRLREVWVPPLHYEAFSTSLRTYRCWHNFNGCVTKPLGFILVVCRMNHDTYLRPFTATKPPRSSEKVV